MLEGVLASFLCVDRAFECNIAQPACSRLDIPTRIKSPVQDLAESQLGREDSRPGGCSVHSYISCLDQTRRNEANPGITLSLPAQMVSNLQLSFLSLCKARGGEQKKDVSSQAGYASEKSL